MYNLTELNRKLLLKWFNFLISKIIFQNVYDTQTRPRFIDERNMAAAVADGKSSQLGLYLPPTSSRAPGNPRKSPSTNILPPPPTSMVAPFVVSTFKKKKINKKPNKKKSRTETYLHVWRTDARVCWHIGDLFSFGLSRHGVFAFS